MGMARLNVELSRESRLVIQVPQYGPVPHTPRVRNPDPEYPMPRNYHRVVDRRLLEDDHGSDGHGAGEITGAFRK
jgi:hypothetical protein